MIVKAYDKNGRYVSINSEVFGPLNDNVLEPVYVYVDRQISLD